MKLPFVISLFFIMMPVYAISWNYQVNVNGKVGGIKKISDAKSTFEAGDYDCLVTPVSVSHSTEYRSLVCNFGTGTVSTGGLCTRREAKNSSVQYAILNLNGPKSSVNVVVSCGLD